MKAFLTGAAFGVLSAAALCAAAYVYEPFDYPDGQRLGKCYAGVGFKGGSWNDTTGERGEARMQAEGLNFGELASAGGAMRLDFTKNAGNESLDVSRNVMEAQDSAQPVWISLLCRIPAEVPPAALDNLTVFFRMVGADRAIKYRFSLVDKKAALQHAGGKANERSSPRFAVKPGVTYLLVAFFPGLKEGRAPAEACAFWVLEVPPEGWKTAARTPQALRALLDKAAVAQVTAPMTDASLRAGDVAHVGLWGRKNAVGSAVFDEIRIGSSPDDVLPLSR